MTTRRQTQPAARAAGDGDGAPERGRHRDSLGIDRERYHRKVDRVGLGRD